MQIGPHTKEKSMFKVSKTAENQKAWKRPLKIDYTIENNGSGPDRMSIWHKGIVFCEMILWDIENIDILLLNMWKLHFWKKYSHEGIPLR